MKPPEEILIIKPSSLGDVVHTLPAVARLKRHWPQSRLRWLINPEWAPLLAENPFVDEIVPFPRGDFRGPAGWARIPGWARQMAARPADLVLDFQGLLRSALIARLCRRKQAVGLDDAREGARWFYDLRVPVAGCRHAVDRYLALAAAVGAADEGALEWPLPSGSPPERLERGEPFVLLHPFSRGAGKSLSWTEVDHFCRALAPVRVVLAGRSPEPGAIPQGTINLLNRTSLHELIWAIRQAAFVVSVDSGPMHIAAALTPRLVAIHAWSDPAKVGPYRPEAWIWQRGSLFQAKAMDHPADHRPCPDLQALAAFVTAQLD